MKTEHLICPCPTGTLQQLVADDRITAWELASEKLSDGRCKLTATAFFGAGADSRGVTACESGTSANTAAVFTRLIQEVLGRT